ncbi:DsbA family protein [Bifidobacterium aquikefiricola]|uniref:Thioredoxin domain-containing protein n=1 Tax=Bifidobacterium aquikefiricola TaxID=3059038 RepID=A0AB39U7W4_9BIFI
MGVAVNRERRIQTVIGLLVVAVVVLIIMGAGVAVYLSHRRAEHVQTSSFDELQQVGTKSGSATDEGGIPVSVNGHGHVADAPTVEVYIDPMCPACGQVDRALNPTLLRLVQSGQVSVELHLIAFLDRASSDSYSTRASSALAYVAEHDPRHAVAFMGALFEPGYQPDETRYVPTGDDKIANQAIHAGMDAALARKAVSGEYRQWVDAATTYTVSRKALQDPDRGSFATPLLRINHKNWPIPAVELSTLPETFLKSLGLAPENIGSASIKPIIGANGTPS